MISSSVYVTYVESEGPLLKIWGQRDKTSAIFIEKKIQSYTKKFKEEYRVPRGSSMYSGLLCLGKYDDDGSFYRAKVRSLENVNRGEVLVHFIDYGNHEVVTLDNLRLFEAQELEEISGVPALAEEFYLAGVVPSFGEWTIDQLAVIRRNLCYVDHKCAIVATVGEKNLLLLLYEDIDFSKTLIDEGIGLPITFSCQEVLLAGPGNANADISSSYRESVHGMRQLTIPSDAGTNMLSVPKLDVDTQHEVRVSFVEDGPSAFSIQLLARDVAFQGLITDLNSIRLRPLSGPLLPGTACVVECPVNKLFCRAVVTSICDRGCVVYFVDIGHSAQAKGDAIYELPDNYCSIPSFSVPFSLGGLQDLSFDELGKKVFEELVKQKVLVLRVIAPERPLFRQYGDLFCNGQNILLLLLQRIYNLRANTSFSGPRMPNVGEELFVTISHVVSVTDFFVHLQRNAEQLVEIRDRIDLYIQGDVPGVGLSYNHLSSGRPVCAYYPSDGKWYRAKIMSVSGDRVSVLYVDYGNTEMLPLSSLRQINADLLKIRSQAVACSLHGFEALEDNERQSAQLEKDYTGKILKMKVLNHLPNDRLFVDLLDLSVVPPVNIGREILHSTPDSSSGLTEEWQEFEGGRGVSPEVDIPQYVKPGRTRAVDDEKRPQKHSGGWKEQEYSESQQRKFTSDRVRNDRKYDDQEDNHASDRRHTFNHPRDSDKGYGFRSREKDTQGKKWSGVKENKYYEEHGETFSKQEEKSSYSQKPKRFGLGEDRNWNSNDRRNVPHEEKNNEPKWGKNDRSRGENGRGYGSGKRYPDKDHIGNRSSGEPGGRNLNKFSPSTDHFKSTYSERNERTKPHQISGFGSSRSHESAWSRDTSPQVFHKAVIPLGAHQRVDLVFAANPSDFVLQICADNQKLSDMMTKIATKYTNSNEPVLSEMALKVAAPCIARFPEDNNWYRAVVEQVIGSEVVVKFVDYGNIDTITKGDIKKASPDLFSIPIFGLHCTLLGVQSQNNEWSEEEISSFMDLTDGQPLMAHFCRMSCNKVEVILTRIVGETEDDVTINEKFGAENLKETLSALSAEKFPELASVVDHFNEIEITPGLTEKVVVTWFINPSHFFCQLKSNNAAFVEMMNKIQTNCSGRKPLNHSVPVGTPVIAKFPADNVLYRAEVKEVAGARKCVVQFVDYGNYESVDFFNIWPIDKSFMSIPRQAILSALMGVVPVDSDWPNKCTDYENFFGVEDLDCKFHGTTEDGSKMNVSLYQGDISIATELVNSGLAAADEYGEQQQQQQEEEEVQESVILELLKGQQLAAHVTYINNIMDFHVQVEPKSAGKLQEKLQQLEDKEPLNLEESSSVDGLCLVMSGESQYFRGRILETDTSGLLVELVDFGNQCRIERNNVWSLPFALASIPFQAVKCCVVGATKGSVPADLEDHFKNEVEDQDVIMLVKEVMDGRLSVQLFDVEGQRLELLKSVDNSSAAEVKPVCPCPVLRSTYRCWIPHVDGPYMLWMQRVDSGVVLAQLLEDLYTFYELEGCGKGFYHIEADKICAAKSATDGGWYRACIKEQTEEGVSVCFLDYGNSEEIPLENVKELDPSFFSPARLAFCASLPILVIDEKKSTEVLTEMVSNAEFEVTLQRSALSKWIMDTGETNNLSQQLIDRGIALPIEQKILFGEIPRIPQVESDVQVVVSHIDSPEKFWVQRECCMNYIRSIAYCLLDAECFPSLDFVVEDLLCAAFCKDKNQWCRGVILSVCENDSTLYEVYFIDNGKVAFVDNVRQLPENLLKIPALAIKCSLKLPEGLEAWPNDSTDKFCKLSEEGKALFAMEIEMIAEPLLVCLLQDGRDIGQELLQKDTADSNSSEAFISHITSLTDFWIQDNSLSHQLDRITERLCDGETFNTLPEILEGSLCAALFAEDGQWYRAKVLSCNEQDILVFFIDYGNSSSTTEVRCLPTDLLNIPPLAKHCSLVVPAEQSEWPVNAEEEFFEKFGDGTKVFKVSVLQEGDPSVVSLSLYGQKVEDILLKNTQSYENETNDDLEVNDLCNEETESTPNVDQIDAENVHVLDNVNPTVNIPDITVSETLIKAELGDSYCSLPLDENDLVRSVLSEETDGKNNIAGMAIKSRDIVSTDKCQLSDGSGEENIPAEKETCKDIPKGESSGSSLEVNDSEATKMLEKIDSLTSKEDCDVHCEATAMVELMTHETSFSEKLVTDLRVEIKTPCNDSIYKSCASEQATETEHKVDSKQEKDSSSADVDVLLQSPECTNLEGNNVNGETQ